MCVHVQVCVWVSKQECDWTEVFMRDSVCEHVREIVYVCVCVNDRACVWVQVREEDREREQKGKDASKDAKFSISENQFSCKMIFPRLQSSQHWFNRPNISNLLTEWKNQSRDLIQPISSLKFRAEKDKCRNLVILQKYLYELKLDKYLHTHGSWVLQPK